jgi:hypothetical protein
VHTRGYGTALAALTVTLALTCASCTHPAAVHRAAGPAPPVAVPVTPDPRVGALFPGDGPVHTCSASVLDTARGDLVLTAAHCLADDVDATFVPGLRDDGDPDQDRRVEAAYFDPRWLDGQDPRADFAILRVAGGGLTSARNGRGVHVGAAPPPGTIVTVRGYAAGSDATPIGCRATTAQSAGFPELPCDGLVAGLSGAPWTVGSTVVGLVGGLDGGGCAADVSYSPPFDASLTRLLARAEAGGPGDEPPPPSDDGC